MTLLSGASAAVVHATALAKIALRGTVGGSFLAQRGLPDTGATIQVSAGGHVSPLAGRSTISGTARIPGLVQNGQITGNLTIRNLQGSITVKVVGRITTPPSNTQRVTYGLAYAITGGTGQFSHVRGNGIVIATLIPTSSPSSRITVGKLVLTFR